MRHKSFLKKLRRKTCMWWKSECYFRIKFNPFLTSTSHVVMFNVFGFSAKSEKRCCSESELTWPHSTVQRSSKEVGLNQVQSCRIFSVCQIPWRSTMTYKNYGIKLESWFLMIQTQAITPGPSGFWDQSQANSPLYSAFWSVEQTDFKNVIVENIHWALFEDAEVAEVNRPRNSKRRKFYYEKW